MYFLFQHSPQPSLLTVSTAAPRDVAALLVELEDAEEGDLASGEGGDKTTPSLQVKYYNIRNILKIFPSLSLCYKEPAKGKKCP